MEKLFVPYELAVKLKEKGFDEPCLAWFNNKVLQGYDVINLKGGINYPSRTNPTAPLFQQVVDWFREKHNMDIVIIPYSSFTKKYSFNVFHITKETNTTLSYCTGYDYYDLVQIDAIKSALTLI